ncbi:MAG: FecR domain-containing protein [Candidatus Andeanibacterium colombiense]|uniref:FecR domain-containing protein n=1 Tax=Candidatus Andeanibacterium colombiense TaxID=3121345 RepID=A0AAJ5X8E6_9SPHN|nr:MAG: FecR domain-containing protein [Sphingomonadaceae bacterium]
MSSDPSSPERRAAREWVLRLAASEIDDAALAELAGWRRAPTNNAAFEKERRLYRALGPLEETFAAQPTTAARRTRRRAALVSATGALAAAAIAWLALDPFTLMAADRVTGSGEIAAMALPDGSRALLDSESALAVEYRGGERRVRILRGEAWFDVKHDPAHPFTVEANGATARALGTAYGVERGEDGGVSLAVTRGLVGFTASEGGTMLRVPAGATARIDTGTFEPRLRTAKPGDALAWRSGRIVIENRSLGEVAAELSRYRRGTIVVLGAAASRRVSGVLKVDEIDRGLAGLAAAQGLSVTHLTPWLVVLR